MTGRAVSDKHVWVAPEAGTLAVAGIDYGYMAPRGESEDSCTPFCMGTDTRHKWYYCVAMPASGVENPWCAETLAKKLSRAGFGRLVLRSDTEPSIIALKRAAAVLLKNKFGTEIVPEGSSVGDSSSNGLAEHAVREVKAKARVVGVRAEEVARWRGAERQGTGGDVAGAVGGDDDQHRPQRH